MKALVGAFNQEKAIVRAFSVIMKTGCKTDGSFAALVMTPIHRPQPQPGGNSSVGCPGRREQGNVSLDFWCPLLRHMDIDYHRSAG